MAHLCKQKSPDAGTHQPNSPETGTNITGALIFKREILLDSLY